ncbi:uncharacterized protein LOC103272034 [Carlito syrichta]|uniref:Uncharacterized protein LOC103272034 n=1 Tax=Carlito syrichta TaxID=1868482 RepID=A0A1U7U630_CARSF|nr:uncharacterized protein LOC103272034 [Carlito syrichta]
MHNYYVSITIKAETLKRRGRSCSSWGATLSLDSDLAPKTRAACGASPAPAAPEGEAVSLGVRHQAVLLACGGRPRARHALRDAALAQGAAAGHGGTDGARRHAAGITRAGDGAEGARRPRRPVPALRGRSPRDGAPSCPRRESGTDSRHDPENHQVNWRLQKQIEEWRIGMTWFIPLAQFIFYQGREMPRYFRFLVCCSEHMPGNHSRRDFWMDE